MDAASKLRERDSRRTALRAIARSLEQLEGPVLSRRDLNNLRIQQLSMSLGEEQKSLFFKPYKAPIRAPEIDTLAYYYPDFGNFNFGQLMDISKNPRWQVHAAWNMPQAKVPHMKVLMYSGIIGNEHELFRGELLAIIDVMCGRLNTRSLRSHIIAPVSALSHEHPAKKK
uniref:Uncharacterized protein n=1 Tax=Coccidioides posadasii RMSCC 3488 TaxID=454284 RepID=A0A0J6FGA3_COCPO|nr:hypothetical protein CPAG_04709 [Coccidioides posadasii RMSCC 3488]